MKKQKSHGRNISSQKQWLIGILLVAAIAALALLFLFPKEESSVLKALQEKNGYIRTVGKEEYDFFEKLVERDLAEELSPEQLQTKTKAKINRVNADDEVMDGAKTYLKKNWENYRTIEKIVYLFTENGSTEEKILLYEEMSTLEKTDSKLFEFLYNGKEGDELEYVYQENSREIEIKSVEYEKLNFENNIERVMRDYVTNVYLENWLQKIEEKCPVEFKLS